MTLQEYLTSLRHKTVAVIGIGVSNRPLIRLLLERGNELLAGTAHSRTTLAMVPDDQRAALSAQGWVCWQQTLALSPTLSSGVNTFAANTLRRLNRLNRQTVYLTMDADPGAVRVLPTLLRQLKNNHYLIRIPMETRL